MVCSKAYALPQDWPCGPFVLHENKTQQSQSGQAVSYHGKQKNYVLDADVYLNSGRHDDVRYDDCGTAGCPGTITDTKTGKTEVLNFFCKTAEKNRTGKITCYINNSEEYILTRSADGLYTAEFCGQYRRSVDPSECEKCSCTVRDSRNKKYTAKMRCRLEGKDIIHCMTGNMLSEKYEYDNNICPGGQKR